MARKAKQPKPRGFWGWVGAFLWVGWEAVRWVFWSIFFIASVCIAVVGYMTYICFAVLIGCINPRGSSS